MKSNNGRRARDTTHNQSPQGEGSARLYATDEPVADPEIQPPERQADRRVLRTRRALTDALITLTIEQGYESVTIRDITERAGVGYATFFRHYPAKEALLADVLEAFLEELSELVVQYAATDPETTGRIVFEHAARHRDLYLLLLASRGSTDLLSRVHEVYNEALVHLAKPRPDSPVPLEIAANHMITSFISLIAWWLEHGSPYSAAEMGRICSELIIKPTQAIAFGPASPSD